MYNMSPRLEIFLINFLFLIHVKHMEGKYFMSDLMEMRLIRTYILLSVEVLVNNKQFL